MSEQDDQPSTSYEPVPRAKQTDDADQWTYRYHAAAIYLEQGENNEKFYTHPQSHRALPAYLMIHNDAFYIVDLLSAITLLALALIEQPSVTHGVPIWIHALAELVCLFVVSMELGVRLQWLGFKRFVTHKRTIMKTAVLFIMFVEACVVLVRQESHFRITRALRPIFLIDTHYSYNVRRFIRQIFLSLPAVVDMLLLLMVFMIMFSTLGYFFYSDVDKVYFDTPLRSFVSLFVLLTTANNPDVMMAAYSVWKPNALFFIIYLCIELYFIMNLLLAVVYDAFSTYEKDKFRKLYMHRREACERAFELLITDKCNELKIEHFIGMMQYFRPRTSLRDILLDFNALSKISNGRLSLNEFYHIYEIVEFRWHKKLESLFWADKLPKCFAPIFGRVRHLVNSPLFTYIMYFITFACGVWFFVLSFLKFYVPDTFSDTVGFGGLYFIISVILVSIFGAETVLKIIGLGPERYCRSGWNLFDLVVTIVAVIGISVQSFVHHSLANLIILRFLGLFRLLQHKKRYRDVFDTVSILVPRFVSAIIVLILLYYSFAILAMEIFQGVGDMRNCCINTTVERNYAFNVSSTNGYYYLNTFDDLLISGVTLWDLMVVNNWYIIMEGYAAVVGEESRTFFMFYYIVMMVVLTIVVAFILEGFLFRIQCSRDSRSDDFIRDNSCCIIELEMSRLEMDFLCSRGSTISEEEMHALAQVIQRDDELILFEGIRWKDRFDFTVELYKDDIEKWLSVSDQPNAPSARMPPHYKVSMAVRDLIED